MASKIDIDTIGVGIPVLVEGVALYYKESCLICLDHHNYSTGVLMVVLYDKEKQFQVVWTGEVNDSLRRAYRDNKKAIDNAACAFALLIMREHGLYGVEQASADGSTIDYYLSLSNDDTLIFNQSARLEVSGILSESESNTIKRRIQEKKRRLKKDSHILRDIIAVICFNPLRAEVIEA